MADLDLTRFVQPEIRTAEVAVPATGIVPLTTNQWLTDDPILVDRFVFTEDTLIDNAVDPGAHFINLADMRMQFWQRGVGVNQQTRTALPGFQTAVRQRVNGWPFPYDSIAAALIGGAPDAGFLWRLPRAVRIESDSTMYVRWENPVVARVAALAGATVWVTAHGIGVSTGRPCVMSVMAVLNQSPGGGAAGPFNRTSAGGNAVNDTGEEVDILDLVVHVDTRGAPTDDSRICRHYRIGVEFTSSGGIVALQRKDNLAPLVAWGSDSNWDGQCVIWEPRRPILWRKREITQFEFQEVGGQGTRMIVSAVGRVEASKPEMFPPV